MSVISEILGAIAGFILSTILALNYAGIFIFMILESMVFPVPSEVVMPFAGYLAATGQFNLILVIAFSTLGSIIGSLFSYYIGKRWGTRLIVSYGKYILVDLDDLKKTEAWFTKRGELTIFASRLTPVVRHLISLVAGVGKMNIKKFTIYTIAGAAIWNALLAYLGYILGKNWEQVTRYTEELSIVVVILLVIGCIYYVYRHVTKRKNSLKMKAK